MFVCHYRTTLEMKTTRNFFRTPDLEVVFV
jgi:hypothetical protein